MFVFNYKHCHVPLKRRSPIKNNDHTKYAIVLWVLSTSRNVCCWIGSDRKSSHYVPTIVSCEDYHFKCEELKVEVPKL